MDFAGLSAIEIVLIGVVFGVQLITFVALTAQLFIVHPRHEEAAGAFIRLWLRRCGYVSGVAWVVQWAFFLALRPISSAVVEEWLGACVGIYLFAYLSIFDPEPPKKSDKGDQIEQKLVSINLDEQEGSGAVVYQAKRLELREDYYAMTWCSFHKQI